MHPLDRVLETIILWQKLYRNNMQAHAQNDVENNDEPMDLLQLIGLAHQRDDFISALSQGQQKRLALLRLKLEARPVWILDEPETALDAEGCDILRGWLRSHLQAGGSVIFTAHQQSLVKGAKELRLESGALGQECGGA